MSDVVHYAEYWTEIRVGGTKVIKRDFARLFCGETEGEGSTRWSDVTCQSCLIKRGKP